MTSIPTAPRLGLRGFDWRENIVYIGFAAIFLIFSIALFDQGFLNPANLLNILRQTSIIAVMAVGMTFVISAAEIDLSVGAVAGLSSVLTAMVVQQWGLVPAILAGLATGALCGLVTAAFVTLLGIPSFLVTLGMLGVATGAAMWISASSPLPVRDDAYIALFGSGNLGVLPVLAIWMIVFAVVGQFVLRKTRFGRHVLATGGNPVAARYSAINPRRIKATVLVVSGVVAGFAGMLYAGRLESGRYQWGAGDELSVIAAVVLGGTSLFGGKGSVIGAVFGAMLIGLVNNGIVLLGLDFSQQTLVRGAIIILAVALARRAPGA